MLLEQSRCSYAVCWCCWLLVLVLGAGAAVLVLVLPCCWLLAAAGGAGAGAGSARCWWWMVVAAGGTGGWWLVALALLADWLLMHPGRSSKRARWTTFSLFPFLSPLRRWGASSPRCCAALKPTGG
jgi:hypothetical protein